MKIFWFSRLIIEIVFCFSHLSFVSATVLLSLARYSCTKVHSVPRLLSALHQSQNPSWDLSEPTKFWKNTLVIYLDFVFVVNLLIHNLILYSVFKVHVFFQASRLVVENKGFEPLTPCVQGRCSPSWANSPYACLLLASLCCCSLVCRLHTGVCALRTRSRALWIKQNPAQFDCCSISQKTNDFQIPTLAFCVGFLYYCFTRSENFLVFSV